MAGEIKKLAGELKPYAWGKTAPDCLVARASGAAAGPFAEWWLGGDELPFLFKLLSIGAPLSVQLHPSRALAERLHATDPAHYPDRNHKPEVAIAVTDLELLWGFRPAAEILQFARERPEFGNLLSDAARQLLADAAAGAASEAAARRRVLADLLSLDRGRLSAAAEALLSQLAVSAKSLEESWAHRLLGQFGTADIGVFFVFVLNLCRLPAGAAIFTPPGVLHAYLDGEIVECMATSDNVVRLGLTPKFCDAAAALEAADYETGAFFPAGVLEIAPGQRRFQTPAAEFLVEETRNAEWTAAGGGPQLLFQLEGQSRLTLGNTTHDLQTGEAVEVNAAAEKLSAAVRGRLFSVRIP